MAINTKQQAELMVLTKSKELCSYIMTITHKSPKEFRFSLVSRLHNLALGVVENIIRANEIFMGAKEPAQIKARAQYQRDALTDLMVLSYIAQLSMEQKCILFKQYEHISTLSCDCLHLLKAWISSDSRRIGMR